MFRDEKAFHEFEREWLAYEEEKLEIITPEFLKILENLDSYA